LIKDQYISLYEKGITKGKYVGFRCLKDLYSVKRGCTTYITGSPTHGKTEFLEEIKMNLTEFYGWKHLMFSPEIGSPPEIYAELAAKYHSKPFSKTSMTELEVNSAYDHIQEYYTIIDDESLTIDNILEIAAKQSVDTITIDPWNELYHNFDKHAGREDVYLEYTLGKIRRFARKQQIHFFLVVHPRTLQLEGGKYSPPTFYQMKGGSSWANKGESIICVFRESKMDNKATIIIQKAKPKVVGNQGECYLYFDRDQNRYYEENDIGMKSYANKYESYEHEKNESTGQNQLSVESGGAPF